MVGRTDAVEALSALLLSHRFVNVIGTGGMGKTTVAICVGHVLCDGFNGGAYFVDLGAVIDPARWRGCGRTEATPPPLRTFWGLVGVAKSRCC
jgi:hypothetical protein